MMELKRLFINTLIFNVSFILVAIASPLGSTISYATEYFVAKTGNDTQPGTKSAPLQTIRKGISLMTKGDTLYIRQGTYKEFIDSQRFRIPTGTSWDNAPVIAAYPGETVIIRPEGGWQVIGLTHSYIQYVIFDRLIVDASGLKPEQGTGISMTNGANHVRFRNIEVKNAARVGVLLTPGSIEKQSGISIGGTFNEFIGGKYHDTDVTHNPIFKKGGYNFYIATNNNLIDGAEVYNATGYGFHIYNGVNPRPSNNVVRNCRIYNNSIRRISSAGILLGSGKGNMAYNNLIYNGRGHGVQVANGSVDGKVYNNTIYDNDESGISVGGDNLGATNSLIKNNILYKNRFSLLDMGVGTIESNNIKDGVNPLFMTVGNLDFHLQSKDPKSPAIDAGQTLSELSQDFYGNPRPEGANFDIGAVEFNQSAVGTPKKFRLLSVK